MSGRGPSEEMMGMHCSFCLHPGKASCEDHPDPAPYIFQPSNLLSSFSSKEGGPALTHNISPPPR